MKKIIFTNAFLILVLVHGFAQKLVEGVVTNSNGETIPGVSVVIKGTTQGTVTDLDGKYQIKEVSNDATLVFTFIGMATQEVAVGDKKEVNVTMKEDNVSLDDVVVVGYGTQTKQNLTGSVAKLSSDKIVQRPVSSVETALQGQVSGVQVTSAGGPGSPPLVRVRGIGSVNFDSDPLYVVDGVPVGNLNNFDVKDIESVSVLKDAASAAIYGSRAANGVVIITTKKGSVGDKMSLNIDASYGTQKLPRKIDLLTRDEYIEFGTEIQTNSGAAVPERFSNMDQPVYEGATKTFAETETDWQDEAFRIAPMSQLNVTLSGGTEKSRIYTSYSKYDQDGIMIGTGYSRHSFRLNTENRMNDHIVIGENVKVSFSETQNEKVSGARTMAKHILNQVPYIPVYNPTTLGGFAGTETTDGSDPENPIRIALLQKDETRIVNVMGNTFVQVRLAKWLTFKSSLGLEYTVQRDITELPIFEEGLYGNGYQKNNDNQLTDDRSAYFSPTITNQLTFDKTFDKKHSLNAVAFIENQTTHYNKLETDGKQPTNDLNQMDGTYDPAVAGRYEQTALISYAGRINYAYDQKYLLNFSLRRDGSSVFAPGNKWGNFPGASIGWIVSKESFMENMDKISNLKLYASYGSLGFNKLAAYPWQSSINSNTTYPFDNDISNQGAYFNSITNRGLTWEITNMTNFGFDLGLFKNTVTLSAEYFVRNTDNMIVEQPLPLSLGYSQMPETNIGSMKNWGYEFNAGYTKKINEITLSVDGNISIVKNEVLKLSTGQPTIDVAAETGDYGGYDITRTEAGQPIQSFYGWEVEKIFQTQEEIDALNAASETGLYQASATSPGDIKFKDNNGDGHVDEDDRVYLGNFMPDFTYGLNFSASYKGFSASLFIQGVQGNEIYNGQKVLTSGMLRLFNADKDVLDAWTPENTDTDIPRAISGDPNANTRTSDRFIEDGSYLRLKNLSLGYSIPANLIKSKTKNAITGARVYVTGQNLLTLTKYSGWDPEIGSSSTYSDTRARLLQGVDFGFYPQPRTFIFGINMSF